MLPDYPETKTMFSRFLQLYMRQKMRQLSPLLQTVQTRYLHEGRGLSVLRSDATESRSELEAFSSVIETKTSEIEHLTFQKVLEIHDALAIDMVQKHNAFTFRRMGEEIPDSQTVDAKGITSPAELLLQALEKVQVEFNPDGTPHALHVMGGLLTQDKLAEANREAEGNPELKQRGDALMDRKREEWRAREASRKLVG